MATKKNKQMSPESLNPDVGTPAQAAAVLTPPRTIVVPAQPKVRSHISGDRLTADVSGDYGQDGIAFEYRYWIGVTPSCPVESITCAGLCFPKLNENLIPDPMRSGTKARVPVVGAIVMIDRAHMEQLIQRIPRTVVRLFDRPAVKEEPGTGMNIGDNHVPPQRGQLITIPSIEDVEQAKKRGRPTREYSPKQNDVPAARYMFAQLCADQENGSRSEHYPETLETTGLDWPGDL